MGKVESCEHKNQTKKRYPRLARCKDCGALVCPDCDGTGKGLWATCTTCMGKGTIDDGAEG